MSHYIFLTIIPASTVNKKLTPQKIKINRPILLDGLDLWGWCDREDSYSWSWTALVVRKTSRAKGWNRSPFSIHTKKAVSSGILWRRISSVTASPISI